MTPIFISLSILVYFLISHKYLQLSFLSNEPFILIIYSIYALIIEVPLHEFFHLLGAKVFNIKCEVYYKSSLLKKLTKDYSNKKPNCRPIGKIDFFKMLVIGIFPVILFSVIWSTIYLVTVKDIFIIFFLISILTAIGDIAYILFGSIQMLKYKGDILFLDEGTILEVHKKS